MTCWRAMLSQMLKPRYSKSAQVSRSLSSHVTEHLNGGYLSFADWSGLIRVVVTVLLGILKETSLELGEV